MDEVKIFRILYIFLFCRALECFEHHKQSQDLCKRVARDPYFDVDIVVGKSWRIYHTWHTTNPDYCMDMVFTKPTKKTVERIRMEMAEYMEQEPNWDAAVLKATVSIESKEHEVLLFADQGGAGSFLAVPNRSRDPNLARKSVPLLKLQMKLMHHGKYLLAMDCYLGGASLAARPDDRPYRAEMASEAAAVSRTLYMKNGFPACIKETHKDEQFQV